MASALCGQGQQGWTWEYMGLTVCLANINSPILYTLPAAVLAGVYQRCTVFKFGFYFRKIYSHVSHILKMVLLLGHSVSK